MRAAESVTEIRSDSDPPRNPSHLRLLGRFAPTCAPCLPKKAIGPRAKSDYDPVPARYPTPRTVITKEGLSASLSILERNRCT